MKDIIEQCLNNWEFDLAEDFYIHWSKIDDMGKKEYIFFLYNTAQFYKLSNYLKTFKEKQTWWDLDMYGDFNNFKEMLMNIETKPNFIRIELFLSYNLQKEISMLSLTARRALEGFRKILSYKNSLLSKFLCVKLINYFSFLEEDKKKDFFISRKFEDEVYLFSSFLYNHIGENENVKFYLKKYNNEVKNILSKDIKNSQKKVAICFYGVLRGLWKENLEEIISKTAKSLNADCFLFGWDEYQQWCGLMGGANWALRCFGKETADMVPYEISDHQKFKKMLPQTYMKLQDEYNYKIKPKEIDYLISRNDSIKKIKFENQLNLYFENSELKMYYGMQESFRLMKEYEKNENIEYDIIIIMRSDVAPKRVKYEDLCNLQFDEISDLVFHLGSGSGCIAGRKTAVEEYIQVYNNLKYMKSSSNFIHVANNHEILYKYPLAIGLSFVPQLISSDVYFTKALEGLKIPKFNRELQADCNKLRLQGIEDKVIDKIISFFSFLEQKYNVVEDGARIFNRFIGFSTKSRIQNQLSYKLGQAMIANSKSLLGYIRMPFILSYIYNKHKQEQKIYQEKIKQNPSLKLPPLESYPDYEEALKEKECLTYKLGEALIQANKTWYKGGYIKLWFEIRKLKKEFEKKGVI